MVWRISGRSHFAGKPRLRTSRFLRRRPTSSHVLHATRSIRSVRQTSSAHCAQPVCEAASQTARGAAMLGHAPPGASGSQGLRCHRIERAICVEQNVHRACSLRGLRGVRAWARAHACTLLEWHSTADNLYALVGCGPRTLHGAMQGRR